MAFIRPAVAADAARIAAIYNVAVTTSTATFDEQEKTPADRARWLAAHEAAGLPVLVAEQDGETVGWGSLSSYSDRCSYRATTEISVYIDEHHLHEGLGYALSRALIEAAPAHGVHTIMARICSENTASIGMTRKLGFAEVGTLHESGRKFGRWLDVTIFELLV